MKRFLTMGFLVCSFGLPAVAQKNDADSLKQLIPQTEGIKKADLLNAISKAYWSKSWDSSAQYAGAAYALSTKIGYKRGIGESLRSFGNIQHDGKKSESYFNQAIALFNAAHDKRGLADTYNNMGTHFMYSNYARALVCYDSSLSFFHEIGYRKGEGAVLNYIGVIYQKMGNFQKAIDYTLQGLEVRKKTDDIPGVIYSLLNLGNMYLDAEQLESALKLFKECESFSLEHGLTPYNYLLIQIARTFLLLKQYEKAGVYFRRSAPEPLLLGQFYSETNRPDSALIEFRKSLAIGEDQKDNELMAASFLEFSKIFAAKKDHQRAKEYAERAYALAKKFKNDRLLAQTEVILKSEYERAGDFKKALFFMKQAHNILDSVSTKNNENFQRKLAFFESKTEIEKEQDHVKILSAEKALQVQKLSDETRVREMILAGTAIILLISFFTIRNINQKRQKMQVQKDLIDQQKARAESALEELKNTQTQLLHREKMASLGELMAGIAHEIQNPLNFVNNFSEVNDELLTELQEAITNSDLVEARTIFEDIRSNSGKIMIHGKRADNIVKGMLLHSRSKTGEKESTDINMLVEEFLRLSFEGMRTKDKSLRAFFYTTFDKHLKKINVIPQDIGRVFLNIFNNAFYSVNEKQKISGEEYTPEVSVSTRKLSDAVEIRIRDNGLGIVKDALDKIFNPFFTTKPTGQGTGLGLSLSYDIITKLHSGSLNVETKAGEFAEFIVLLPAG